MRLAGFRAPSGTTGTWTTIRSTGSASSSRSTRPATPRSGWCSSRTVASRSSPRTSASVWTNGASPISRSRPASAKRPRPTGCPTRKGRDMRAWRLRVTLERAHYVPFLKLTSGVFAGVFIAFLSFFYDPNDRAGFGGKLGLLVGVLFAVLVNLRTADTSIGDVAASDAGDENSPGHPGDHRRSRARRPARPAAGRARHAGPPSGLADARRRWRPLRARRGRNDRPCGLVVTGGRAGHASPHSLHRFVRRQIGARLPAPGRRDRRARQAGAHRLRADGHAQSPSASACAPADRIARRATGAPLRAIRGATAGAGEHLAARGRLP